MDIFLNLNSIIKQRYLQVLEYNDVILMLEQTALPSSTYGGQGYVIAGANEPKFIKLKVLFVEEL